MSVSTSVINKQPVSLDSILVPSGYALATAPNLAPDIGKIAFNTTDNRLYLATGAVWLDISSLSNMSITTFGATPNAQGGTITTAAGAQTLTLQPASNLQPGGVSTGDQFFAGIKSFVNGVRMFNLEALMSPFYNSPSYFEQAQVTNGLLTAMILSCGANSGQIPAWHVQKAGRMCFLALGTSTVLTVAAGPTVITAAAGTIPSTFRPISVVRKSICFVTNGATNQIGYVTLQLDGSLVFAIDINGTGFTGTGQIQDCLVSYTN